MISTMQKQMPAKPFLKWAGGKTQLLDEITKRLPPQLLDRQIDTYIEPFLGGGSVFFYIAQNYPKIKKFYLYDVNDDLVRCYKAVKTDFRALIKELKTLSTEFLSLNEKHRKDFYLHVRSEFNLTKYKGDTKSAAKLIFLNKTCFNGLYRVNSKNKFNVPFGGYKNPKIYDEKNLLSTSEVLQKAEIICGDFADCMRYITKKTFLYLDPPYRPLNATAGFTAYSKNNFLEQDQLRLAEFCKKIDRKGAKFLLSNSDPKNEDPEDNFFEDNYSREIFRIERVDAIRAINCIGTKRGPIKELIITN